MWSRDFAEKNILDFKRLSLEQQKNLLTFLNDRFPPSTVEKQKEQRRQAISNLEKKRMILSGVTQEYPACIASDTLQTLSDNLSGYAVMLTAGGEGERLRQSLQKQGFSPKQLTNFTKATFPLPDFYRGFGTLQVMLTLIGSLCEKEGHAIPTIVTTGPAGSVTADSIPEIIQKYNNFGLAELCIINQNERLHLTGDEQIVYTVSDGVPRPVTNPDETGGPVMRLKQKLSTGSETGLEWLRQRGCTKIILLQATALYDPALIYAIAAAGRSYDGLGVGISRSDFPEQDPFGTYVQIVQGSRELVIVEQEVRNDTTRALKDASGKQYLPLNTGFYAFDCDLIERHDLPDYATPPKEILPGLPRAPKIGYAATDIIAFAKKPAVLTIPAASYHVIKNADDPAKLSLLGKQFGLDNVCAKYYGR